MEHISVRGIRLRVRVFFMKVSSTRFSLSEYSAKLLSPFFRQSFIMLAW